MAKRNKATTGAKSVLKDGQQRSTLEFMEAVQDIAAGGTLDTLLESTGAPGLPKTATKVATKRFSKLVPFERSKFDYEKYCAAITANLVDKKNRKA